MLGTRASPFSDLGGWQLPSIRASTAALALVLCCVVARPAAAQGKIVDELLLGVLAHDAGVFGTHKEGGADFNGEVRFVSPDFLAPILAPRPHLGVTVNSEGNTNQVYA